MKTSAKKIKFIIIFITCINYSNAQVYFTEDFENPFTGNPAAPAGWTQSKIVLLGPSTKTNNGTTGPKDWQRNTYSGSWAFVPATTANVAAAPLSGSACLYIQDSWFGPTTSTFGARRITTPVVNLNSSTSPYIRFYFTYGILGSNSTSSVLRVVGSNDGGNTWKVIMQVLNHATTAWQRINILIPAPYRTANSQFGFEITNSSGTNDVFIDNLSIEEFTPSIITSAASGNWSASATWVGGIVPNCDNHVVIDTLHSVGADVNIARCQNMEVKGTFQFGTNNSSHNVQIYGDLTVNAGGIYSSLFGTFSRAVFLGGHLTNNGTINFSGLNSALYWIGGKAVTYSGSGNITSSFVSVIRHANSGGVTYNAPIQVRNTVSLYDGQVNPNGNLTIGNSAVANQTIEVAKGSLSSAPIWGSGVTRSTSYNDGTIAFTSPAPQTCIPGEENQSISGVRTIGGTMTMNTWGNVQLNYPLSIGTGTSGALTLTRGIIVNDSNNVLIINNTSSAGNATVTPSTTTPPATHGSYVSGAIRINFGTSTTTRTFPLGLGSSFNSAGDGAVPSSNMSKSVALATTAAWTAGTALTVSVEPGGPTGSTFAPMNVLTGKTLFRVNRNGGPDIPSAATVTIRVNNYLFGNNANNDSLIGDQSQLAVVQSTSRTGPWTQRSLFTGSGSFVSNTYYPRTTATASPGPISPLATNGEYFCFATSSSTCTTPAPGQTLASVNPVCNGVSFTLSLQNNPPATGTTYQWQSSADSTIWNNISGATNATLVTSQTATMYYRCNVSCSVNSSSTLSLPVLVNLGCPSFSGGITNSSAASVCSNSSFTVSLTGATSTCVSYQWQVSPDSSIWTNISGATNSSRSVSQTSPSYYRCRLTCNANSAVLHSVPVKVIMMCEGITLAGGSAIITSTTGCPGNNFTLALSGATTSPCIIFQWQSSEDSINYVDIVGATSGSYTGSQYDTRFYRCRIYCESDSAVSQPVKIVYDLVSCKIWIKKNTITVGGRSNSISFVIGDKVYIGTGINGSTRMDDFWEYNHNTDSWTQKANVGGNPRSDAIGFSIGSKGYAGLGVASNGSNKNDFWSYDPSANAWTQKGDFTGGARFGAVGFAIDTLGYAGTGSTGAGSNLNDFWQYNPASDSWVQKTNFSGLARNSATCFVIGNKGYVGTGLSTLQTNNDLWEYNPGTNTWVQKASLPGNARYLAASFSLGTNGYLGTGYTSTTLLKDFWEYNQLTDTWLPRANYRGNPSRGCFGFSVGNKGYFGMGYDNNYPSTLWQYLPEICSGAPEAGNTLSSDDTVCLSSYFILSLQNISSDYGITLQWQKSADNISYQDIPAAKSLYLSTTLTTSSWYRCRVSCINDFSYSIPVRVNLDPVVAIISVTPSSGFICPPGNDTITISAASNLNNIVWTLPSDFIQVNDTVVKIFPSVNTSYHAAVATPAGCTATASARITVCGGESSKGKDFWLMFNSNYDNVNTVSLFITSEFNTSGVVSGSSFSSIPFTVSANTVTKILLPSVLSQHTNGVVDNKGIHVTSDSNVSVYGLNQKTYTSDAFLCFPVNSLGNDYRIMAYNNDFIAGEETAVEFGITAIFNNTTISITPSVSTLNHPAGIPYNIILNQGETYELRNGDNETADFTGTKITSSQIVSVFGGHRCVNIPAVCTACDHIIEMLPPVTTWGQNFGIVPLRSRTGGDQYRFLANEDSTIITINSVVQPQMLHAGQFLELNLTSSAFAQSSKPILVSQFARGGTCSGLPGDPLMLVIPPLEQFLADYTITTVIGFVGNYVNLVVPNSIVGQVKLDGINIAANLFSPISSSSFSGAQLIIDTGSHHLSAPLPFGAFVYGFNDYDSYGYAAGQAFSQITSISSLVLTPDTVSSLTGINKCWQVLVKDQNGIPLPNIRVDFSVRSTNIQNGFSYTNDLGIASFCYAGNIAGVDSVFASSGAFHDTARIIWVQGEVITFNIKLYIEGFYQGNGLMIPVLYNNGDTNQVNCDSIIVALHHAVDYSNVRSDFVKVNINGNATIQYPSSISESSYYVVIRHRNAVETWSKNPVSFTGSVVNFDFTVQ